MAGGVNLFTTPLGNNLPGLISSGV